MATMDGLKALDELKDAGIEERPARALAEWDLDPLARELQQFRIDLRREVDALLASFDAHLVAATALHLGGTTLLLVLTYALLR